MGKGDGPAGSGRTASGGVTMDWSKVHVRELKQDGLAGQRVERFAHMPLAWEKGCGRHKHAEGAVWIGWFNRRGEPDATRSPCRMRR